MSVKNADQNTDFNPFYLVKTETTAAVLSILHISRVPFDCFSSGWSQSLALFLGYKSDLNVGYMLSINKYHRVKHYYFELVLFSYSVDILPVAYS